MRGRLLFVHDLSTILASAEVIQRQGTKNLMKFCPNGSMLRVDDFFSVVINKAVIINAGVIPLCTAKDTSVNESFSRGIPLFDIEGFPSLGYFAV